MYAASAELTHALLGRNVMQEHAIGWIAAIIIGLPSSS
jgi:hypothetical protein